MRAILAHEMRLFEYSGVVMITTGSQRTRLTRLSGRDATNNGKESATLTVKSYR